MPQQLWLPVLGELFAHDARAEAEITLVPVAERQLREDFELGLSKREIDVARLLPTGMSYAEIGVRLIISKRTVEAHVRRIQDKKGLANRNEIVTTSLTPEPEGPQIRRVV